MSCSLFEDEKFEEGKGPNTEDLLAEENVDILPYIGWEEEMEDSRKRELVSLNLCVLFKSTCSKRNGKEKDSSC